ncbi:putative cytochrome P450 hydroxylase [Actinokineospora spheciospongiae]|uniref:Putative cytochrome P450 hydroxylase n=1 Tax=Actinokineospora spheciospongiae TaxID=909613 RepID=W7J6L0_9PSEU|nr:cytochrome P450 [Actinokineospora spheciospongiae]EWC64617.1 putative cytochrome P450 hydroxylase [Actinokineospora spheciospongiae]
MDTASEIPPAATKCPYAYPFHRPSAIEVPPLYEKLREEDPVAKVSLPSGDEGYVVSRYEDAKLVLSDLRFSRAATVEPGAPKLTHVTPPPNSLFTLDPPEHTRLRKLVAAEFTNRRVREMRPRIQQLTDDLLDEMAKGDGHADLNVALAFPMPVAVICELLGVPFEDREKFRNWSNAIVALTTMTEEQMMAERLAMAGYIWELVQRKRAEPGSDLLSALITAHDDDNSLDEGELVIMAMTLLVAGHETTVSMIGACVLTILRQPHLRDVVDNHPEKIGALVEELLRVNPIGDGGPIRITLEDVEVAGTVIPKGSAVMAAVASGNRDDRRYLNPTEVDVDRENSQHLAFGHGVHFCLGANLARLELEIAIRSVFERFPTLRLDTELDALRMKSGMMVHGLESLPVTW